jgi:hypothetical protein
VQVEQLSVETLIDISQRLQSNPSEYDLLKVSGLLRPILLENLLDRVCAAASVDVKFRVVKPAPVSIPPEVQRKMDEAWAKVHATRPDVKRVDVALSMRTGLLTGELWEQGDQIVDLSRSDFLRHPIGFTLNDVEYTVESMLRLSANSLGGIHNDGEPNRNARAEELRQYMENGGASWCGRSMAAGMVFDIACCTLRACEPLADKLTELGLYAPASSEWVWSFGGRRHAETP